jgi:hypothetical protein
MVCLCKRRGAPRGNDRVRCKKHPSASPSPSPKPIRTINIVQVRERSGIIFLFSGGRRGYFEHSNARLDSASTVCGPKAPDLILEPSIPSASISPVAPRLRRRSRLPPRHVSPKSLVPEPLS